MEIQKSLMFILIDSKQVCPSLYKVLGILISLYVGQ